MRKLAWAGLVFAAACGPDTGPKTVHVFGFNPDTKQYGYFDAKLETLADLPSMRGDVVSFVGGADVIIDVLEAVNDPKSVKTFRAEGGGPPSCAFDDVGRPGLQAEDFDSLAMASSYWALERAKAFFVAAGVQKGELNTLNAYYNPRFQAFTKLIPTFWFMTDNAAYAPPFDGFLIVPHIQLSDVPFSMNLGVMAHEYGHKVHNHLVERDARSPHWQSDDWTVGAANQIRAADEGLSDVWGGTITGDSNYIWPSIATATGISIDRDMAKKRVIPQFEVDFALTTDSNLSRTDQSGKSRSFDPHTLGAYLAAALWQLGGDVGDRQRIALRVLQMERDLGNDIKKASDAKQKYDYSIVGLLDLIVAHLDPVDRPKACSIFKERFALLLQQDVAHKLSGCP